MAMALATCPRTASTSGVTEVGGTKQTRLRSPVSVCLRSSAWRGAFQCSSSSRDPRSSGAVNAAATAYSPPSVEQKTKYHFLVANAKFMLDEEEHLQELLRERLRNYGEKNKKQDFWLVVEPKFLDKFPEISKRLSRPAVALVSTDPIWITFMKLRIDRVLKGVYEADDFAEALSSSNSQTDLKFEAQQQWTAPYPKYETGWWTPFLPSSSEENESSKKAGSSLARVDVNIKIPDFD